MAKAVFLDRDETLNPDPGYIDHPGLFELYPWVATELKKIKQAGFLLIIVSNQSGVGRGLISQDALQSIHEKLDRLLFDAEQIRIDAYSICTHRPEDSCSCRKPKPKLILDAAAHLDIKLDESYMIGDRDSDYEAGMKAGVRKSYLIAPGNEQEFKMAIAEILKNESK